MTDALLSAERVTVTIVLVIGLTGGIASGKSTVARLLADRGATVIDADVLGHEVYRPGTPVWQALLQAFGSETAGQDGAIDRRRLGAIVFSDQAAMQRLTAIVWPAIKDEMQKRLERCREAEDRVVVVEAAVLLEAGWQDLVDEVWVTVAEPDVAVARLMQRSGLSRPEANARLASQTTNDERVARSDFVIRNNGSIEELAKQVDALWTGVLKRAA